jgi:hypothetical protein
MRHLVGWRRGLRGARTMRSEGAFDTELQYLTSPAFSILVQFQRWFRRVQTTVVSPPQLQGCLEQHQPGGHGNR